MVLDELATSRPNRPTEGLGWTVPRLAEAITQMCGRWDIPPSGAADDAIFARSRGIEAATIADEFSQQGVTFWPAGKGKDRKRVVLGQRVADRVDLGGRGIIKKKN